MDLVSSAFKTIEAGYCFRDTVATAARYWGDQFICQVNPLPGCKLNGDRYLLQLALLNVLDNAVKFSPPDLPVTLRIDRTENMLNVSVYNKPSEPLPDDTRPLFNKFFRGSNSIGTDGAGLGLYLARDIIEQHGGCMELAADNAGDVVATMRLPLDGTMHQNQVLMNAAAVGEGQADVFYVPPNNVDMWVNPLV